LRRHDDRPQQGSGGEAGAGGPGGAPCGLRANSGDHQYYWWDNKINRDPEQLLYLKTMPDKYQALETLILSNHSYDTPEILQLPVEAGLEKYLGWMQKEVR
jgi:uncharacterized protein involved in tolerance to divalent cations